MHQEIFKTTLIINSLKRKKFHVFTRIHVNSGISILYEIYMMTHMKVIYIKNSTITLRICMSALGSIPL